MSSVVEQPTNTGALSEVPKKKTRRRLRVSCVECTRRRQKCDRNVPCGLCRTRGVPHLCRWETEPYARPPPARPPGRAATRKDRPAPANVITNWQLATNGSSISVSVVDSTSPLTSALGSPISQAVLPWRGEVSSPSSTLSPASTHSRASLSPLERPNEGLKEAALALARMQLSEEDHRLGEGSLAFTLQELSDALPPRTFEFPLSVFPQLPRAALRSSEPFIPRLPDKAHCEELLMSFNEHVNWLIGIPPAVLFSSHEAMWIEIRSDPAALQKFNSNWLALLFAIFAFSPACRTEEESRNYFNQALAARKLEEDRFSSLDAPRASMDFKGAVYTCLATAFLARYLQDRGRVSEAWRVVGSGLRDAQNAGLHRFLAPGNAKHLTNDERTFMLVSWHLCVEFDRYLSLFLGRPTVVRSRDCNVQLPPVTSSALAPDGSTNTALLFQYYFISMTKTVSESKEKFLCEIPEPDDGHAYFDARMNVWLANLPPYWKLDGPPDESYNALYQKLHLQRLTLRTYYSCSCLLYHRALAYAKPSPDVPPSYGLQRQQAWDQSQLARYAIEVLHSQCELTLHQYWERQVPFDVSMYMFEAAVTLGVTILRFSYHPSAEEWRRELASAIEVFESLRARDYGKIVSHAIQVLKVLQDLCNDSKAKVKTDAGANTNVNTNPNPNVNGHGHGYGDGNMNHGYDHGHGYGHGSSHNERVVDPTVGQEESKSFFNTEGVYDSAASTAANSNTNTFASAAAADASTDLFGNVWIGQPADLMQNFDSNHPIDVGGIGIGVGADPATAHAGAGYTNANININGHGSGAFDFTAYPTWTTGSDGYIVPTFGPEANINLQYA